MREDRVDRLLRLAEEAAVAGDEIRVNAFLDIADRAIYLRNWEVRALKRLWKQVVEESPADE